jgi:L-serine dehydratase
LHCGWQRRAAGAHGARAGALYGSLGATGKGHGSDKAVLLGLAGHEPDTVDVDAVPALLADPRAAGRLALLGTARDGLREGRPEVLHRRETPALHANGMRFRAFDAAGGRAGEPRYYSVGGGFVVSDEVAADGARQKAHRARHHRAAAPRSTAAPNCCAHAALGCSIAEVMRRNERHWRSDAEIDAGLLKIWQRDAGLRRARLPHRRHAARRLQGAAARQGAARPRSPQPRGGPARPAAGAGLGEPVRAGRQRGERRRRPRGHGAHQRRGRHRAGGAALLHALRAGRTERGVIDFLLTAAAIGILYKENASLSGAEVGCQGEVGVACSMAAGALCAVMGGTPEQAENAAEIGMEHHLGLTCDPVGGLVQIPCIERNAIASVKAINAARMALRGDGTHHVSLDKVIKTMRETGADMMTKYKETARGGLAVNIVEC